MGLIAILLGAVWISIIYLTIRAMHISDAIHETEVRKPWVTYKPTNVKKYFFTNVADWTHEQYMEEK